MMASLMVFLDEPLKEFLVEFLNETLKKLHVVILRKNPYGSIYQFLS